MKVTVIKKFRDKETGAIRNVGDTFECTAERADEILSVGDFIKKPRQRRAKKADAE